MPTSEYTVREFAQKEKVTPATVRTGISKGAVETRRTLAEESELSNPVMTTPLVTQRRPLPPAVASERDAELVELRAIRRLLEVLVERQDTTSLSGVFRPIDPRHVLLEALAETMEGFDLEFTAEEVLARGESDHGLDAALKACHIEDTAGLGALFRTLRDRELAGLRLIRDGRSWRLART
jgi:hypothetical protein